MSTNAVIVTYETKRLNNKLKMDNYFGMFIFWKTLNSLFKIRSKCSEIERKMVLLFDFVIWRNKGRKLLTASNFGIMCNKMCTTKSKSIVNMILYSSTNGDRDITFYEIIPFVPRVSFKKVFFFPKILSLQSGRETVHCMAKLGWWSYCTKALWQQRKDDGWIVKLVKRKREDIESKKSDS